MKRLLLILILTFSFQTLTKADDISDFEIEGMSVGDSLLDHFDITRIKGGLKDWYPDKTFSYSEFRDKKIKQFDKLGFFFKPEDDNYKIYSISGMKFCTKDIKICYDFQNEIEKEFEKVSNIKPTKKTIKYPTSDDFGTGSFAKQSIYLFENGDAVFIETKNWANDSKFHDNISLNVDSRVFGDWLSSVSN